MTLLTLLDEGAAFDAEYAGGLSNHRPMTLCALARLGADDARLQAWAERYSKRLRPAPAAQVWPAGQAWAARLGEPEAWPAYRDLFWHWLRSEDAGDVLQQVLPTLMVGCGAAAFHGLIRTAHAVQQRHAQELADGLAYWACRWLDLRPNESRSVATPAWPIQAIQPIQLDKTVTDPEALLRGLRASTSAADLIFQRMADAAAQPGFAASVAALQPGPQTLPRLATLAAQAYAASGNFTALHLVTSAHALSVLTPYLDDVEGALMHYWRAYAAAVCAAGLKVAAPVPPTTWPQIVQRALNSNDEHLIKLVDTCREAQSMWGGQVWLQAAQRAVAASEVA